WTPAYISVAVFRDHVRTFADVFPYVVLAFDPAGDIGIYMFGAFTPLEFEPAAIHGVLARPGVLDDLRQSLDAPAATLDEWERLGPDLVVVSVPQVRRFAEWGPLPPLGPPPEQNLLPRRPPATTSRPHTFSAPPS